MNINKNKQPGPLRLLLSITPLFFAASQPAIADQTQNQTIETVIVTANRDSSALMDEPGNLTVIGQEQLDTLSSSHINEILLQSPGVTIHRGNGQEHLTAIRSPVFTGAGSCGPFLMAEDGIPLRASGFCNVNQLLHSDWEQAGRIEIIRGPGNALYGSNAMHGIINIISAAPSDVPQGKVSLERGPHDYTRGKFSYSDTKDSHGYRINLNGTSDGGYQDDAGFDQQKLSLRHDYNQNDLQISTRLRAINLNQETAGFIKGDDAYKDEDLKKTNPNPEAYRDVQSLHLDSRFAWQVDEQTRFVVTPYVRDTDMEFMMHFVQWKPVEENGHSSIGVQSALYHIDDEKYRWTSGFDLEYTDGYLRETQANPFDDERPQGAHYDYDIEAMIAATFAQLNWQTGKQTEITAGVRFEHTQYDYNNKLSDGSACIPSVAASECRFTRPADTTESFAQWSPNIGALYHLSDQQTLFVNLRRGYRAPETAELFRLQNGDMSTDSKAVEMDSLELGTRHQNNKLYYEATVYGMKKRHDIFLANDGYMVDNGKTRHHGLELASRYQVLPQLEVAANYSYSLHQYDNSINLIKSPVDLKGKDIDTAPRHTGSLQLGWAYIDGGLAQLEWVHMGKYYTYPDNLQSYPGHDLLNLRIRQQIVSDWSAALRVANLTDRDYAERADFAFGTERYFVGEPRSVYVSVEGSF